MQRTKNDVMSSKQKNDLNFFTEPQYQKIVMNNFHSSQIQFKTTGKIDIHINERKQRENLQIVSSGESSH